MPTQHSLFFGKKPAKSLEKDGQNLPLPQRRFQAFSPQKIEIRFDNTTVTQFGGCRPNHPLPHPTPLGRSHKIPAIICPIPPELFRHFLALDPIYISRPADFAVTSC